MLIKSGRRIGRRRRHWEIDRYTRTPSQSKKRLGHLRGLRMLCCCTRGEASRDLLAPSYYSECIFSSFFYGYILLLVYEPGLLLPISVNVRTRLLFWVSEWVASRRYGLLLYSCDDGYVVEKYVAEIQTSIQVLLLIFYGSVCCLIKLGLWDHLTLN